MGSRMELLGVSQPSNYSCPTLIFDRTEHAIDVIGKARNTMAERWLKESAMAIAGIEQPLPVNNPQEGNPQW